jgi:hypothetical protein
LEVVKIRQRSKNAVEGFDEDQLNERLAKRKQGSSVDQGRGNKFARLVRAETLSVTSLL